MSQNTPKPRMATLAPTQKVQAGGAAAAITILIVWCVRQFAHVEVPAEVAMAISAVVSALASYITPPNKRDRVIS